MARHRAERRRGWLAVAPAAATSSLRVGNPSATTRVATTGVLAAAALGGALTITERLGSVEEAVSDTLSGMATAATWSPVTPRPATPMAEPVPPEPEKFNLDSLLKAVAATERELTARATQREQPEAAVRTCPASTSGFGRVKNWVATSGKELRCRFDVDTVHGLAARAGSSDHPSGLALDFMVNRAEGDKLAAYALKNKDRLGITYVIWRQRINYGSGWRAMEDRGGATANHQDHVHVSFQRRPTPLDALT